MARLGLQITTREVRRRILKSIGGVDEAVRELPPSLQVEFALFRALEQGVGTAVDLDFAIHFYLEFV